MNIATNPIRLEDKHVGAQIKARRNTLDLTQSNVADALGLSFQQLQKYETGANRVSASKICDLAKVLNCSPTYFFEGIGENIKTDVPANRNEAMMLDYMRGLNDEPLRALLEIAKHIADANAGLQPILNKKERAGE